MPELPNNPNLTTEDTEEHREKSDAQRFLAPCSPAGSGSACLTFVPSVVNLFSVFLCVLCGKNAYATE